MTHIHDNAQKAAEAAEAAGAQGAFWAYHDELFAAQQEWSGLSKADARVFFTVNNLIFLAGEGWFDGVTLALRCAIRRRTLARLLAIRLCPLLLTSHRRA